MADQIEGGRKRVGGLTLADGEREILDRAAKLKGWSRAELLRNGALVLAAQIEQETGAELVAPEEAQTDPAMWQFYLKARTQLQQLQRPVKKPSAIN